MANYVKFYRGTQTAYNNLLLKNDDTLYFVYETDANTGKLYLGSKLIAGAVSSDNNGTITGDIKLSQLKDVLISADLASDSFLVYDNTAQAWVNKSIDDLTFIGATVSSAGIGGLVPPPEANQIDLFLRSDGEWAIPEIDHTILTIENADKSTHQDLLNVEAKKFNPISGDIIIIKDLIYGDKWQYTAYVYDNGGWQAMDGNYDAENVYFSEDLITTTAIGNIELTDGQAVISTAGKNLKQVFETIFVKEVLPEVVNPSISLTFNGAKGYEVGTEVEPKYSAYLNAGSYTYGPATGIAATSWSVTDGTTTLTSSAGTFPKLLVTDDTSYSITATATYGEGSVPVSNLSNECPDLQIKAGSTSTTKGTITGYRNAFYGSVDNKNEITADVIRNLTASNKKMSNGSTGTVNIPTTALRVIIAYPETLQDLTSVTDTNAWGTEVVSNFKSMTLDVPGYNNYEAITYKVFYADFAEGAVSKANTYEFTI